MKITSGLSAASILLVNQFAWSADRLVPSQYPTIQAAIDVAADGDVVQIAPGSYYGPIDTKGKAITVRGTSDASAITLSGGGSVLSCISGETPATIIENLTITGGTGTLEYGYDSGIPFSVCRGGGVRIVGSSPVIRSCRVVSNAVSVTVHPSEAQYSSMGWGAGVYIAGGSPRLESCLIAGNQIVASATQAASARGGGVCIVDSNAVLSDCSITGNSISSSANPRAYTSGAGVHASGGGSPRLERCIVTTNSSTTNANYSWGTCAAVGCGVAFESAGMIVDSRVSENLMSGCGGSVGGVEFLAIGSSMSRTRVCGNSGAQLSGAYINLGGNSVSAVCIACSGDLDGDGKIDGADLGMLLSKWGSCSN
jgi:hypothetical protein